MIILDGFDEMKHAMSLDAFVYNFDQINLLVEGRSKIVVLGRPSAFMSEDEKQTVLHGYRKIGDIEVSDASKKDYREIEVALFDREQLTDFIVKYLEHMMIEGHFDHRIEITSEFIERRQMELLSPDYEELISRPVHARMLITIALSTDRPLSNFSRFTLYKEFTRLILEREDSKLARKKTEKGCRLSFLERVAWESWVVSEGKSISVKSLSTLIGKTQGVDSTEDALRELITGSILEPKGEDSFYFVHRSFQEFLAAQHLISNAWVPNSISVINKNINKEITKFLEESQQAPKFADSIVEIIGIHKGVLDFDFLDFLTEYSTLYEDALFDNLALYSDPWTTLIFSRRITRTEFQSSDARWLATLNGMPNDYTKMAFLLGLNLGLNKDARSIEVGEFEEILRTIASKLIGVIQLQCLDWINHVVAFSKAQKAVFNGLERKWANVLIDAVTPKITGREVRGFEFDFSEFGRSLHNELMPELEVTNLPKWELPTVTVNFSACVSMFRETKESVGRGEFQDETDKHIAKVRKFWLSSPTVEKMVTVESKKRETSQVKRSTLSLKP